MSPFFLPCQWGLVCHLKSAWIHVCNITWSQVSRSMTSSVARSDWVKSPGTSSTWKRTNRFKTDLLYCYTHLCPQSFLFVTYNNSSGFVGAAKQTWRLDHFLQGFWGLVLLFATESRPEISCRIKETALTLVCLISKVCCCFMLNKSKNYQAPCPLAPGWGYPPGIPPRAWKPPSPHLWRLSLATRKEHLEFSAQAHRCCSGWRMKPRPEETDGKTAEKYLWAPIRKHRQSKVGDAHLHSAGSSTRALSDVEEASAGRLRMSTFGRGASEVDDHGFATEQAHQVRRLLPLSDSHLVTKSAKTAQWRYLTQHCMDPKIKILVWWVANALMKAFHCDKEATVAQTESCTSVFAATGKLKWHCHLLVETGYWSCHSNLDKLNLKYYENRVIKLDLSPKIE